MRPMSVLLFALLVFVAGVASQNTQGAAADLVPFSSALPVETAAESAPTTPTSTESVPDTPVSTETSNDVPVADSSSPADSPVTASNNNAYKGSQTTQAQCVQSPLGRVRSNSIYARTLIAGGAPLVPCNAAGSSSSSSSSYRSQSSSSSYRSQSSSNSYRPPSNSYRPPASNSYASQAQCVQSPLGRVRSNSIYARTLIAGGAPLVPCSDATATQCVQSPLGRVRSTSIYARALLAGGASPVACDGTSAAADNLLQQNLQSCGEPICPQNLLGGGARIAAATMDSVTEASSSAQQSSVPAWGVALIVLGTIILVGLLVVLVQVFILVRRV